MENINDYKEELAKKFFDLPMERQQEIAKFYERTQPGLPRYLIIRAKEEAQSVIDYADRKGYGYGEVGYNINEEIKDFAEDTPELEKEYKHLINAYFDLLVEVKEL